MAETQLTDAEVLILQATQTAGEEADGAADSGFQWSLPNEDYPKKMTRQEQKVLVMAAVSDAGRVFKDGDLTYGVRAIAWYNNGALVEKAEVTAQALANNDTNYVYYQADGTLVDNVTGFPADEAFIPLATILTAAGTYAFGDITDKRQGAQVSPAGSVPLVVEENTAGVGAPNVLTAAETRKILSNEGSTATNYHTLPTAVAGLTFTFVNADATDLMRIVAAAADQIIVGPSISIAAGYIESTARGDTITLVAMDEVFWMATSIVGTWNVETS